MSLLGNILGGLIGGGGNQSSGNPLLDVAAALIQQNGGLQGVVQKFQKSGLGQQADSWVGTGQNLPVSADQIMQVLGSDSLKQMAGHAGMDQNQLAGGLAGLLPQVIDHLTPGGQMPQQGNLTGAALQMLKGKLFG